MKNAQVPRKPKIGSTGFRPNLDERLAQVQLSHPIADVRKQTPSSVLPDDLAALVDPSVLSAVATEARAVVRQHQSASNLNAQNRKPLGPASQSSPKENGGGYANPTLLDDADKADTDELVSVMAARLRTLEEQVKAHKEVADSRARQIKELQHQLQEEKKRLGNGATEELSRVKEENAVLHIQATRLTRQVLYLKEALKAKGLEELLSHDSFRCDADSSGPPSHRSSASNSNVPTPTAPQQPASSSSSTSSATSAPTGSRPSSGRHRSSLCNDDTPFVLKAENKAMETGEGLPFDMKVMMKNIAQLNRQCGPSMECGRVVETGQNIHKFTERKVLNLVFYADGLCLNDGPFRPYHWPAAQAVVHDVMDGYFPYELKGSYPDGVPFKVLDKSTEKCPKEAMAGGSGSGSTDVHSVLDENGYKVVSKTAFLNKLPKQVLKNGQLIEVRDEIAALLGGGEKKSNPAGQPIVVQTAALEEKNRCTAVAPEALPARPKDKSTSSPERGGAASSPVPQGIGHDIATIQVKCQVTPQSEMSVFIVHLFHTQTVGELKAAVKAQLASQQHHGAAPSRPFALCTVYPSAVISDESLSLVEAKLVPTATVHVRWL